MSFLSDVRRAFRNLSKARGFAAAVILTLALGIGANTAMFTLLRGTLLRPLPNREGEKLVYLRQSAPGAERSNVQFSVPEVADVRAGARTLAAIAEYSPSPLPYTMVAADGEPLRIKVGIVSGNYFAVMGLEPILGRLTAPRDDGAAAASVTVLSYQYWMKHFGGDPHIVGTTIRLND